MASARMPAGLQRRLVGWGRTTVFHLAGIVIQLCGVFVLSLCFSLVKVDRPGTKGLSFLILVLTLAVLAVLASPALSRLQRRRARSWLGLDIPLDDRAPEPGRPLRLRDRARRRSRHLSYHLVVGPALAVGAAAFLALWVLAIAAVTSVGWIWVLPVKWRVSDLGRPVENGYDSAAGLVLIGLAALLGIALTRLDRSCLLALLGPTREEELARRVEELTLTRSAAIAAADAERRRIERDLHDGVQQRLVSLAVNLGLIRATLTDLPESARRVIEEAHREAKDAVAELNDMVRGLHPAVLEDRGLDAALSGVASRCAVPVRLAVDLPARPPVEVESVAYFVVSEALTNVVKHAQASAAEVSVALIGQCLRVTVRDDGRGGAHVPTDPRTPSGTGAGTGTGLAGLAQRVSSVDGRLGVDSPAGGPTLITAELPCAL